jgi:rhodanese-related sulfurtransferase
LFDIVVATSGASEKALQRAGIDDYEVIYLHPGHHVGYYPGAKAIHMKLVFSRTDGRVLGVQAVGEQGAERRVDVIAMAIQKGATVFDLEQAELCYAPQFGAAKDPVNLAGMIAANVLRGDHPIGHWRDVDPSDVWLLDVREPKEFKKGHVEGAVNIPLGELRARLHELPEDRDIWVYCSVGQRAYYATRALVQRGRQVRNLSGGIQTYDAVARRS